MMSNSFIGSNYSPSDLATEVNLNINLHQKKKFLYDMPKGILSNIMNMLDDVSLIRLGTCSKTFHIYMQFETRWKEKLKLNYARQFSRIYSKFNPNICYYHLLIQEINFKRMTSVDEQHRKDAMTIRYVEKKMCVLIGFISPYLAERAIEIVDLANRSFVQSYVEFSRTNFSNQFITQ